MVLSILELLLFTLSDPSQSLPTLWGSILPDWTKGPLRPPNHSLVYTTLKNIPFFFSKEQETYLTKNLLLLLVHFSFSYFHQFSNGISTSIRLMLILRFCLISNNCYKSNQFKPLFTLLKSTFRAVNSSCQACFFSSPPVSLFLANNLLITPPYVSFLLLLFLCFWPPIYLSLQPIYLFHSFFSCLVMVDGPAVPVCLFTSHA